MSMSKKDYETIADVLTTCEDDRNNTLLQLAWRFAEENPNFRWDLFLEAADYNGDWKIDRNGRIASPGKFENEYCYMVLAYEASLLGDAEIDDNDVYTVYLRWGGNEAFQVRFLIDNEGFIWQVWDAEAARRSASSLTSS